MEQRASLVLLVALSLLGSSLAFIERAPARSLDVQQQVQPQPQQQQVQQQQVQQQPQQQQQVGVKVDESLSSTRGLEDNVLKTLEDNQHPRQYGLPPTQRYPWPYPYPTPPVQPNPVPPRPWVPSPGSGHGPSLPGWGFPGGNHGYPGGHHHSYPGWGYPGGHQGYPGWGYPGGHQHSYPGWGYPGGHHHHGYPGWGYPTYPKYPSWPYAYPWYRSAGVEETDATVIPEPDLSARSFPRVVAASSSSINSGKSNVDAVPYYQLINLGSI